MLQRAKGTRDFLPEDKIVRNKVLKILTEIFEIYGFNPVETPTIERMDVLSSKYAGGAEILKETYQLKDQAGRELGLRYDLTVPFARVIAMNRGLRMPFKRYSVGRVFRDGPLKTGRYREFWQCDVDIVGTETYIAEVELLTIAQQAFKELNVDIVIKLNDRRLLDAIVEACEIPKNKVTEVILILDKLDKVGLEEVKKELLQKGVLKEKVAKLLETILCKGDNEQRLKNVENLTKENKGLTTIKQIIKELPDVEFSPSLARGLTYYTGPVFEVFLKKKGSMPSSLAAGGRYDKMIGDFTKDKNNYPATGVSFGMDIISEALKLKSQEKSKKKTTVDVYVISINCFDEARKIVQELRKNKIKTDIDLLERGISKNLNYASKEGIPFTLMVGKKELEEKKFKLKNMENGKEIVQTIKEVIAFLKKKLQ